MFIHGTVILSCTDITNERKNKKTQPEKEVEANCSFLPRHSAKGPVQPTARTAEVCAPSTLRVICSVQLGSEDKAKSRRHRATR